MPPGQQIAFEPALAQMLAQHLHHPAIRRDVVVVGQDLRHPDALGHFEHRVEAVGRGLVRTDDAEIACSAFSCITSRRKPPSTRVASA